MKNLSHKEGMESFQTKWKVTLQTSVPFLSCCKVPIYCFIPFHLRIPAMNLVAYVYAVGLSLITNHAVSHEIVKLAEV